MGKIILVCALNNEHIIGVDGKLPLMNFVNIIIEIVAVLFILDIGEKIKINYYGKESEVYGS